MDLVVLEEDALTVRRNSFRDGQEVVGLAADSAGGHIANAVAWARPGELQPTEDQQELQPTAYKDMERIRERLSV